MNKHQLYHIIKESLYNILYESLQTQRQKYGDELVNKLKNIDPSKTYKYIDKICQFYKDGIDVDTIKDYIDKFNILQNKNILKNKDINSYKTFDQLKNTVDNSSFKTKSSTKKEVYGKPYKIIKNDKGTWLIYKPTTEKESMLLGKNTKWCTQQKNDNMFNDYYIEKDLDFYYIINKETQDKYQVVVMKDNKIEEIRDSADKLLTPNKFEELTNIDPHQFKFDKTNLNGKYVIRYNNGNIKTISYYKHGVLDGKYEKYYKNGNIKIKSNYKNGKLDGKYIEYFENGNIYITCNFKNGKLDGNYILYDKNGNIVEKSNFKNDKLDGEYIQYDEDGEIKEHELYKNGKIIKDYLDGDNYD